MAEIGSIEELMDQDFDHYTPKEVGRIFRVDPKTVVRWEKTGKLEKYDIRVIVTPGGHRRYNKEDIDRLYLNLNGPKKSEEQEAS